MNVVKYQYTILYILLFFLLSLFVFFISSPEVIRYTKVYENKKIEEVQSYNNQFEWLSTTNIVNNFKTIPVSQMQETDEVPKKETVTFDGRSIHEIEDSTYSKQDYNFTKAQVTTSEKTVGTVSNTLHVVPQNTLNEREVMGFLTYWSLSKYNSIDYSKLSTIAYFSLTCYDNGKWVTGSDPGYQGFYSTNFQNMKAKAKANNVKVIVVVKNFDRRSIRDLVSNDDGAGDLLIENIVKVVKDNGLDGVNIDFEYVANAEYPVTDTLRANFVSWHDKLAKRMKLEVPGAHVSTDVFGSSSVGYTAYDIAGLGKTAIDYIFFMNYDYIVTSCYDGKRIFPMSPLYGNSNWNVSYHITEAIKKAPKGKILMGIPYYGIDFRVRDSDKSAYNARVYYTSGCTGYIDTYGAIVDPIYDQWHNSNTIKWNDSEKATWYAYLYGSAWHHGYYDDYRSLTAKYQFVREKQLGGVGIWALAYDYGSSDLNNAIRDNFQRAPFIVGFVSDITTEQRDSFISTYNLVIVDDLGNNTYRVKPISELSYQVIGKIKSHEYVIGTGFEGSADIRTIFNINNSIDE